MSELGCIQMQNQQFRALSYIYLDQFHSIKQSNPQKFLIHCKPYCIKQSEQYSISIMFEFTPNYPKSSLKYQVESVIGLTRDNILTVTGNIEDHLYENRNIPIVYDIIEDIRIWIKDYLIEGKSYEQESLKTHKREEVFERPKFAAFTPVTVESFTNWKKEFDLQQKINKIQKKEGKKVEDGKDEERPSGKEWFLGKKEDEIDDDDDDEEDGDDDDEEDDQEEQIEEKQEIPRDDVENNALFD